MASKLTATEVAQVTPSNAHQAKKNAEAQVKALVLVQRSVPATVENQADLDAVVDFTRKIATAKKAIKAQETSVTRLLDAAKKGIKSWFEPMHEKLDLLREEQDEKVLDYEEELERKAEIEREKERKREEKRLAALRRNEEKKLNEAKSREEAARVREAYQEKADAVLSETEAALNQVVEEKPQMSGVSIVKRWDVEVVDWKSVPDEYLIMKLDTKKALQTCRAQAERGQEPKVRGLRFFQVSGTAAKGLN